MRIERMTATFGKLQHATLELKPGLNIIEAPNEWGKSTWCAFLAAMLYGIDTRAKSTRQNLADKEHYAPWSGVPMSGRMELIWKGKKITLERQTKGRVPMGDFRAYETESGLEIPELTGDTCGEMLLGVEQSVFRRAGFIRLSDLPVTQDDALRRRLNALVTTGDESGDGERLMRDLKDLKNRCRYHRTGLLPQAEEQLEQIRDALAELDSLQKQAGSVEEKLQETEQWISQLQNHRAHLEARAAQADVARLEQARKTWEEAEENRKALEEICRKLPSEEEAVLKQRQLREFTEQWQSAMEQQQSLPVIAPPPEAPAPFSGMSPKEAAAMAAADWKTWQELQVSPAAVWILGAAAAFSGAALLFVLGWLLLGTVCVGIGGGILAVSLVNKKKRAEKRRNLVSKYGTSDPEQWRRSAEFYYRSAQEYEREVGQTRNIRGELDARLANLRKQQASLCGEQTAAEVTQVWQEVSRYWEGLHLAQKEAQQARTHLDAVEAMARLAEQPLEEDILDFSLQQTETLLSEAQTQRQVLLGRIGQYQGRMEAIGAEQQLLDRQKTVEMRIGRLEEVYEAVTIAQKNLEAAAAELQRRFAPRIVSRAQELMGQMTGGRYSRLRLDEDFSLGTGAGEEDVLRSILWRSEGTVDQLYLALRLAVSEALEPEAPLVLDDALVRFDRERLKRALEILSCQGEKRQVILFTCQSREAELQPRAAVKMA